MDFYHLVVDVGGCEDEDQSQYHDTEAAGNAVNIDNSR